jgi:CRISPR-associated endonuclease/helicase Cas3
VRVTLAGLATKNRHAEIALSAVLSFWAKLGSATWPDQYHPVLCHLIDVGQVARCLWVSVFRDHIREWVRRQLGLPDESAAGDWLAFWAACHDIGKISPCFQHRGEKTEELRTRLHSAGFDFRGIDRPHGHISTNVLAHELWTTRSWAKVSEAVARNIAIAVGGHHGIFPTAWTDMPGPLGNENWFAARRDVLALLARLFRVNDLPAPMPPDMHDQSVWMYVAGLTSVADWIGSNVAFFEPAGNADLVHGELDVGDYANRYFAEARGKTAQALRTLGWAGRADRKQQPVMADFLPKSVTPRPLQQAVSEIVERLTEPTLLIVEAPMGEGKTEAGWLTAANWEWRGGEGAYVALPTMATSNQMFDRVERLLEGAAGKSNLQLLHGKAALNDRFEDLKYKAMVYDEDKRPSAVVAEGWFAANKKHGLLAPYGVGTIDQALLGVLQTKHVFVRLFGLAGKCVILDEVHAYDTYMTTLMERLLRWLAALGCPVVLLSATLPKEKRQALLRAYAGDGTQEPEEKPYPRITMVTAGRTPEVIHFEADDARSKTVKLGWLKSEDIAAKLREALAGGGCAAVIRNTVSVAQETYLELRHAFPTQIESGELELYLFHARFPFGRRKEIEDNVLRWFGRTVDDVVENGQIITARHRPKRAILVATQVIEQSLDLDFDLMISDLAPVDLILQRAGRLHRHDRGERPIGLQEPHVLLIEPSSARDGVPAYGKSEFVYARYVLLRSHLVLGRLPAIRLPEDLEPLVEQVYGRKELSMPETWKEALELSAIELQDKKDRQQLDALDVAIADPDGDPLEHQSHQLEEEDPDASRRIQAQTRDDGPSIQLIIVYQVGGRDFLDAAGTDPFDERRLPDPPHLREILNNEITISRNGCVRHYANKAIPSAWRKCGMLRHHRVIRIAADGKSMPGEFILSLDDHVGVRFKEDVVCYS